MPGGDDVLTCPALSSRTSDRSESPWVKVRMHTFGACPAHTEPTRKPNQGMERPGTKVLAGTSLSVRTGVIAKHGHGEPWPEGTDHESAALDVVSSCGRNDFWHR